MPSTKRCSQLAIFATCILILLLLHNTTLPYLRHRTPRFIGGLEETVLDNSVRTARLSSGRNQGSLEVALSDQAMPPVRFLSGNPKPPGSPYSRVMVLPRMKDDDIGWISELLPGMNLSAYIVDDPEAPLHPPRNKGHEVMVYLSYIIDHYHELPDIVVFMHAHRYTHHNNEFLGFDASQMIKRLSNEYVMRQGYVNLRCHWDPGCPEWLYFNGTEQLLGKQEEAFLAQSWRELFPFEPFPSYLAQPCCAQFALSKERILSIPLGRFTFYRDWIMKTPLTDYISGRIWEYSWQFIFTGKGALCPAEHLCYCDAFGVCFGGTRQYEDMAQLVKDKEKSKKELGELRPKGTSPDPEQATRLEDHIRFLEEEQKKRTEAALERGDDPRLRAEECGRPWKDGDGF